MSDLKCVLCGSSEWQNVDEYRYKPKQMILCKSCAFVTYESAKDVDKLHDHYTHNYRPVPTSDNFMSSERKLHYHVAFLADVIDQWKKEGKSPTVVELGAALGMFLNWVRGIFPGSKDKIYGTELTESFVRVAYHMASIKLTDDFDDSLKYDLIMSYKVAEHMPDIDKQLARYRSSMSDDGYLYISVPTWFKRLNNFGQGGYNIEDYYDPNHVNVWSVKQFEYLLKKSGFEIVKEDHHYYDDTYLCKKGTYATDVYKEDTTTRLDQLKRIFDASKFFDQGMFEKACAAWSNFPVAQISRYEQNRQKAHQEGFDYIWDTYLDTAMKACENSHFILSHICDVLMRYEKYEKAIEVCNIWLENHPMDTQALFNISHCLGQKANTATSAKHKTHYANEALKILKIVEANSHQRRYEAMTWRMHFASMIPTPFEGKNVEHMTDEADNVRPKPS